MTEQKIEVASRRRCSVNPLIPSSHAAPAWLGPRFPVVPPTYIDYRDYPFVSRGPALGAPALDCCFVRLGRPADGLLGTPAGGTQESADMSGMVATWNSSRMTVATRLAVQTSPRKPKASAPRATIL